MRSLLRLLVYVPLGLLILFFALANRGSVKIFLDPFPGGEASGLSFEAPLFLVVLTSVAVGVLAGGLASWLTHAPLRRRARQARAEASKIKSEIEQLRQQALASLPGAQADLKRKR
ncbi:lipopolysaccharide assembly protein LapA domain-containing protein [Methylocystis heyeri]|jgi:uncharacterized integral membrane protein|uniref:DUF1049 domain-containing protein n=1 Tax=Methylocystis heyeri TaxID=391905 RepID=A0A6B8KI91_9HYPH|nr:lipopolysaccharide assembly protein LapA domain-containing protein [Methylocystis heyeri]QGM48094.1 DUF1049 domain-containing protein [Methylocystis heyeri]